MSHDHNVKRFAVFLHEEDMVTFKSFCADNGWEFFLEPSLEKEPVADHDSANFMLQALELFKAMYLVNAHRDEDGRIQRYRYQWRAMVCDFVRAGMSVDEAMRQAELCFVKMEQIYPGPYVPTERVPTGPVEE